MGGRGGEWESILILSDPFVCLCMRLSITVISWHCVLMVFKILANRLIGREIKIHLHINRPKVFFFSNIMIPMIERYDISKGIICTVQLFTKSHATAFNLG